MTIGYDVEEGDEEDGEGKEIDHAAIFGCEVKMESLSDSSREKC